MECKLYLTKNKYSLGFIVTSILFVLAVIEVIAYLVMFKLGYQNLIPFMYYGLPSIWFAIVAFLACIAEVITLLVLKKKHCWLDYVMWATIIGVFIYLAIEGLSLFGSYGPIDTREVTKYYIFCFLREGNVGGATTFDDVRFVSHWSVCVQTICASILFTVYMTLWLLEIKKQRRLTQM